MTAPNSPAGPDDRSPGTSRDSESRDGHALLRFPGGRLESSDWTVLAQLATEVSGDLHLASRGRVEIRGVREPERLWAYVEEAGLTGRAAREKSHTILASPLAGRLAGRRHLRDLPEQLEAALHAHEDLVESAQQFLFGFDDGSGDVLAHAPDLAVVADPDDGLVRIHAAGHDTGLATSMADAVSVLVDASAGLLRSTERLARPDESGVLRDLVVVVLSDHPLTTRTDPTAPAPPTTSVEAPPVGWIDTIDGLVTLLAVVPDAMVPARLAEFLGAIEQPSTISADRVIGLHGLTEGMAEQVVRVLAPMGMVFDASSPWVEAARREC